MGSSFSRSFWGVSHFSQPVGFVHSGQGWGPSLPTLKAGTTELGRGTQGQDTLWVSPSQASVAHDNKGYGEDNELKGFRQEEAPGNATRTSLSPGTRERPSLAQPGEAHRRLSA